jgi:electron transport complex protein RnfD
MSDIYAISPAPQLKQKISVKSIMWQVVAALIPALIAAVVFFGIRALLLTLYGVIAAVITEGLIQKWRKVPLTISDGSAVVTGMLIAYNINAGAPWWIPVVGAIFAIAVGKQVFGGLGYNIFNPALLGRAFLMASWPTIMTSGWVKTTYNSINGLNLSSLPSNIPSVITSATPLGVAKALRDTTQVSHDTANIVINKLADFHTLQNLFWGNVGGVLGEVSAAALLLGAAYLIMRRIVEWRIPTFYIGTVFVLTFIFGGINGLFSASVFLPIFHILSGGLILGAFFMATDMVTSPVTKKGRIIFGIGLGILTVTIRLVGGYPEGVSYSILLMNIVVPLLDRYSLPKFFGEVKK